MLLMIDNNRRADDVMSGTTLERFVIRSTSSRPLMGLDTWDAGTASRRRTGRALRLPPSATSRAAAHRRTHPLDRAQRRDQELIEGALLALARHRQCGDQHRDRQIKPP